MPTIKIHNVTTGEIIERELNAEELAKWEIDQENAKVKAQAATQALAAKAEILERLAITEEEAKLLLS